MLQPALPQGPVVTLVRPRREHKSSSGQEEDAANVMQKIRNGTFAKASSKSRAYGSSLSPKNCSMIRRTKIEMYLAKMHYLIRKIAWWSNTQ